MSQNLTKRRKHLLAACILWLILLAVLAVQPQKEMKVFLPTEILQSMAHSAVYGVLAFNFCLYFRFKRKFLGCHLNEITATGLAVFISGLWGAVTECAQYFTPDRRVDIVDWGWDMGGIIAAVIIFYLIREWL